MDLRKGYLRARLLPSLSRVHIWAGVVLQSVSGIGNIACHKFDSCSKYRIQVLSPACDLTGRRLRTQDNRLPVAGFSKHEHCSSVRCHPTTSEFEVVHKKTMTEATVWEPGELREFPRQLPGTSTSWRKTEGWRMPLEKRPVL